MSKEASCAYCDSQEVKQRKIVGNELAWAFPTNIPIVPGHTLICPVRHVGKFEDLTGEEKTAIFDLGFKIKRALEKRFGAEGFHFAWNESPVAGQSVPHFHLHVVPRKPGDDGITDYEPRKFLYRPGSREKTPEAELLAVAGDIRRSLNA